MYPPAAGNPSSAEPWTESGAMDSNMVQDLNRRVLLLCVICIPHVWTALYSGFVVTVNLYRHMSDFSLLPFNLFSPLQTCGYAPPI